MMMMAFMDNTTILQLITSESSCPNSFFNMFFLVLAPVIFLLTQIVKPCLVLNKDVEFMSSDKS